MKRQCRKWNFRELAEWCKTIFKLYETTAWYIYLRSDNGSMLIQRKSSWFNGFIRWKTEKPLLPTSCLKNRPSSLRKQWIWTAQCTISCLFAFICCVCAVTSPRWRVPSFPTMGLSNSYAVAAAASVYDFMTSPCWILNVYPIHHSTAFRRWNKKACGWTVSWLSSKIG